MSGRVWAYIGVVLGGSVSVAANIAHSYVVNPSPPTLAVAVSVFWPTALFVTVEILARVAWPSGTRWALLRFGGLLPVATVAAVVSYRHLSGLLSHYGEDPLTVAIGPLAVDGLMVVATGALLATGRARHAVTPERAEPARPAAATSPVSREPGTAEPGTAEPVVSREPGTAEPRRREPAAQRATGGSLTSADKVMAAHLAEPDATHARIATLAGVSISTVKRYRPRASGSPTGPQAAKTSVNGRPDLAEVASGGVVPIEARQ
ncbi:MAG TPA: DUF2637 domain-containing protein [Micromonosporaceae bacterium]|nr:DUF2637 domain-containing protein [Micromonosporaceae bacterium]